MILVVLAAVALGAIVVGLGIGRREQPTGRASSPLRYPGLIALALVPQYAWLLWLSRTGANAERFSGLVAFSYIPLVVFLALNRRHAWTNIVTVGVCLNVAVIVANGGVMPAPAQVAMAAGPNVSVSTSYIAPGTKDRVIGDPTKIALSALADRFVIPLPGGRERLASVGDCFILLGGLAGLFIALREPQLT